MGVDTCEVIIYAQSGALSFEVVATATDFEQRLADALEQGTVLLDTVDGSKLVISALNVVAIEVKTAGKAKDTPPVKNI